MWNAEIIAQVQEDDQTEGKLVTRTAQRIADKGFSLLDVQKRPGVSEGFNWGRSSHGRTTRTLPVHHHLRQRRG